MYKGTSVRLRETWSMRTLLCVERERRSTPPTMEICRASSVRRSLHSESSAPSPPPTWRGGTFAVGSRVCGEDEAVALREDAVDAEQAPRLVEGGDAHVLLVLVLGRAGGGK
mmetsp:Transcript_54247/g.118294  ORF Transcript_54247/g.118294 Transcript_54247/m.118294 type:complete len:112 (+) Transcript_54247:848-1183(+)